MLPIILSLLPVTFAATIVVQVGSGGNKFSPDTVTAAVGDSVEFKFVGSGHSVSASNFASPCLPASDSTFFSGDGDVGKAFTVTVNDTNPIWFYCPESNHCQSGMVGVVNAPSSGDTLANFKSAAAKASSSSEPPAVQGGVSGDASSASSSSASGSSTATSSGSQTASSTGSSATASATKASGANSVSVAFGVVGVFAGLAAAMLA